ncbi:HAD family hydrolase [Sulfitobacter aestuarii]|uniref:HAD family hydrolase n=1 Tax=Sulfitobacter aestuarii TaxID=2161676 RepID=A0ABW5TZE9_9RHOB
MPRPVTTIGFDADDTLWHNERFFSLTQKRFATLLADHAAQDDLMDSLLAAERRNLPHYGFGIKGFTLSMIETAIEVTGGEVPAPVISEILAAGREMLSHEVELLPHATATLEALRHEYRLVLITKGDLLDQERKLAQSGLRAYFDAVEIVSRKDRETYQRVFERHGDGPTRGVMAGNSMRSDVLPMIEAGGWGVYVPHGLVWAIEHAEPPGDHYRYAEIADLAALPELIRRIDGIA